MTRKGITGSYLFKGEERTKQYSVYISVELTEYVKEQSKKDGSRFKSAYVRELIWKLMNGKIKFNGYQPEPFYGHSKETAKLSMNFNEAQYEFIANQASELRMSRTQFFRNLILQDMERNANVK